MYDTAILWRDGIGSPAEAELQGKSWFTFYIYFFNFLFTESLDCNGLLLSFVGALYPTSMRINVHGQLVVNFRTEARFRGLFVLNHPGTVCHIEEVASKINVIYNFLL